MAGPTPAAGAPLAIDAGALAGLRAQARRSPDAALEKAAQQFEALFLQMLLKSMRDGVPQDGLFDSESTRTWMGMLDQQFAGALAGKGRIGLSEVLVKQLRAAGGAAAVEPSAATPGAAEAAAAGAITTGTVPAPAIVPPAGIPAAQPVNPFDPAPAWRAPGATSDSLLPGPAAASGRVAEFLRRIGPEAIAASRDTGVPARFIVAQAALESGWGRNEIRAADGTASHNLFGIKAGRGWSGRTVETVTTEYVNGAPVRSVEKFRAYDSYAEAFGDYAKLLRSNTRYRGALESGGDPLRFAQGLQQGGYATDPRYAEKIAGVIRSTFDGRA